MTVTVHPGPVTGAAPAPPSKSMTHRALFGALLAGGGTVARPLWSHDTRATLDAVRAMGGQVLATHNEAIVRSDPVQPAEVDAANSGTTLRLATALAALTDGTSHLTGDDSLLERPMGPLADALEQLGATVRTRKGGRAPIEVTGPPQGGHARMPGDVSSQFVSALLMAAPGFPDGLKLELTTPLTSAPYVDMTIDVLARHGVPVQRSTDAFTVEPGAYERVRTDVPGDYSGAAFPLVAGAITGGPVTVTRLDEETTQGDAAVVEILEAFGAHVERAADAVTVEGGDLAGATVDLGDTPDLFPPLAVLAAFSEGETVLEGAPHLKDKESNRITAMVEGLVRLGVQCQARDDGARIVGGRLEPGRVDSRGDHRIQMAFAVAALAAEGPVTIEGPDDAHAVSYPGFLQMLETLGASVETSEASPREASP